MECRKAFSRKKLPRHRELHMGENFPGEVFLTLGFRTLMTRWSVEVALGVFLTSVTPAW